ncbi:MAG: M1 family metallopeptidase [Kofleriaceae bacterium]
MRLLLASCVVLAACPAPAPVTPAPRSPAPPVVVVAPPAPVSPAAPVTGDEAPKLRLPRLFVPASYAARLTIDPARPGFEGSITITGDIPVATSVIWLHGRHLTVKQATATGASAPSGAPGPVALHVTPRGEDLLELRADAALAPGTWQLALAYTGEIDRINTTGAFVETAGGAPYVFSQFEAIYARRVFPCLDEPDSKVPWQLTLEVPKGLVAVSNTPIVKDRAAGASHVVEFAQTKPLPAYLVAFGVGPFDIVPAGATKSGVPVRIITAKGHAAEAAYAAKVTAHVLDLLEAWFQIPYPYPKLDILTIPLTAGFGAMENAGLVTASQGYVLMEPKPSWQHRVSWITGAAHELAHQWFGDYVTTAWWDDIWLNEGFANWMENKITAEFDPAWHYELHELTMRDDALRADALTKARQIRQPIEVPGDILNVFDGITYDKGGSVLNMFERYVGRDVFARGVRAYLKARAFGNATSADFIAAIEQASGKQLAPAFATFLDQPGEPELEATLSCAGGPKLELAQRRYVPAGAAPAHATKPWIVPVCVAFDRDGKRGEVCTLLDAPTGTLALPAKACPRWVMPNVDARGYYRVLYTPQQVTALRDEAWPLLSWSERRALFGDVGAAARSPRPGFHDATPHLLPLVLALSLEPKLLTSGERFTIEDAVEFPADLDRFVADDQRGKLEAWYRMTFGPGAQQLGLAPKPGDDFDAEGARISLVLAAGWHGRDPELVKQAIAAAAHWRDLPEAMREPALQIAVDGNPELVARLVAELRTEKRRDLRAVLITALASQRDPKAFPAALEVLLDRALDLRETIRIVTRTRSEATRALAEAFFRAHSAELIERLPQDEVAGTLSGVIRLFTAACDPARRDAIVQEITTRFGAHPGAPHVIAEATEQLDQCIATRRVLEPELRGWLGGLKLPRPPADKPKAQPRKKSKHR